jgi:uncharacterized OB-fold protein
MRKPGPVASRKKGRTGRRAARGNSKTCGRMSLTPRAADGKDFAQPTNLMIPFYELRQLRNLHAAADKAENAATKATRLAGELRELNRRLDRLGLACQAMWELAQPQLGLTEAMLREKMTEIDLRDSAADGRITRSVVKCAACGHASNSHRRQCIYCGAEITSPHAFG